jgi:hypothetical protein
LVVLIFFLLTFIANAAFSTVVQDFLNDRAFPWIHGDLVPRLYDVWRFLSQPQTVVLLAAAGLLLLVVVAFLIRAQKVRNVSRAITINDREEGVEISLDELKEKMESMVAHVRVTFREYADEVQRLRLSEPTHTSNRDKDIDATSPITTLLTRAVRVQEMITLTILQGARLWARGGQERDTLLSDLLTVVMDCTRGFYGGSVFRAGILVPSSTDPDWLVWYSAIGLSYEELRHRFYIGAEPDSEVKRRGVAGYAYITRKPQLCRIDQEAGTFNHPEFVSFSDDPSRPVYSAFVALPLCGDWLLPETAPHDKENYGVICFDSMYPNMFDDDPVTQNNVATWIFSPFLRAIYFLLQWRE